MAVITSSIFFATALAILCFAAPIKAAIYIVIPGVPGDVCESCSESGDHEGWIQISSIDFSMGRAEAEDEPGTQGVIVNQQEPGNRNLPNAVLPKFWYYGAERYEAGRCFESESIRTSVHQSFLRRGEIL